MFYVRIDKNRKLPATLLLKALGTYKADKPHTWLSCIDNPVGGAVTGDALREIFGDDKRIVTKKLVEVVYFFSIRHHIYLVTLEETAELSAREYTLEKLEEQFSRSGFLRIHKSYLLNYRYVYHIGNDTVELTPHRLKKLPLSHRRSAAVRKRYQYFMRGEDDT